MPRASGHNQRHSRLKGFWGEEARGWVGQYGRGRWLSPLSWCQWFALASIKAALQVSCKTWSGGNYTRQWFSVGMDSWRKPRQGRRRLYQSSGCCGTRALWYHECKVGRRRLLWLSGRQAGNSWYSAWCSLDRHSCKIDPAEWSVPWIPGNSAQICFGNSARSTAQ